MRTKENNRSFHYAWVIFAVSVLMVFTALGFCGSTRPLYLAAITGNLGIPRGLYSIGSSMRYIVTALINLLFGRMVLRLGPRRMVAMGFGCLVGSCIVNSLSTHVVGFYVGEVMMGVGLAWTTTTMVGYVVGKWFTSKKGTIMGFVLAANGIGGATATQILSPVIYASDAGWRNSYRIAAAILVCVGLLVVLLLRNSPEDKNQKPLGDGTATAKKRGREWEGIEFAQLKTRKYYYLCLLCVFLTGMLLQSLVGITSAHMQDRGLTPAVIATALSIHSVALTVAKTLTGIQYDKFGLRITMLVCSVCAVVSILLLAFVSNGAMGIAAETISSFALPLETIMLPLIASEIFGRKAYGQLIGQIVAVNNFGYAVGSPLMNVCYDITGSYTGVMVAMAILMVMVAILMQFVINAAHREREALEAGIQYT